jgi:uncharacterized protein (TIGR03435 family)
MLLPSSCLLKSRIVCVAAVFVCLSLALPVFAQATAAAPKDASTKPLAYDVIAIHPHKPDPNMGWSWRSMADGFSASGITVESLVFSAYNLKVDDQLKGLPGWAGSERFDIQAKMDAPTVEMLRKLPREELSRERRLMLQALLADRFALRIHHESKDLPIYDLVVAKGGLKLKALTEEKPGGWSMGGGKFTGHGLTIAILASNLSGELSRMVVDKTALTGNYDITLKWTPDGEQETATSGPSLFTALQEQLGLKLVSAKGPVDTIVVDHVERPSPN